MDMRGMWMDKLDKVIKALSICSKTGFCEGNNGCPYWKESDWHFDDCKQMAKDALELLKEQKQIVRCKDCKHRFNGEHHDNCCEVLMEKVKWTFEVTVDPDWFCADGEQKDE